MPVSIDTQAAISQQYGQLANSVTHGQSDVEKSILAPKFADRAKVKLKSFELDALTIMVQRIDAKGKTIEVRAQYVGVRGHNAISIDDWVMSGGTWRLASRRDQ